MPRQANRQAGSTGGERACKSCGRPCKPIERTCTRCRKRRSRARHRETQPSRPIWPSAGIEPTPVLAALMAEALYGEITMAEVAA